MSAPSRLWAPTNTEAARVVEVARARWGLRVHAGNRDTVQRALADAAARHGLTPTHLLAMLEGVDAAPALLDDVLKGVTIGETYLFRHHEDFAAVRSHMLSEQRARWPGKVRWRAWSAGCATGEEAYSLAICMRCSLPPEIDVSVLATDVNVASLEAARAATYGRWSQRAPLGDYARYAPMRDDGRVAIDPGIRALVHLAPLNLASLDFPAAHNGTADMDVIFCRNVLVYFDPAVARAVMAAFAACLAPGGYLVPSALDMGLAPPDLRPMSLPGGALALQKPWADDLAPRAVAEPARRPRRKAPRRPAPKLALAPPVSPVSPEVPSDARDPVEATLRRARQLADAGDREAALGLLRASLGHARDPRALLLLGILLVDGRAAEAAPVLEEVLRHQPSQPQAHLYLALCLQGQRQHAAARQHMATVLRLLADLPDDTPVDGAEPLPAGYLRRLAQTHI